jgi:nucleotidyltransferase/DNA polymerase involved in DNA repair
MTNTTRAIIHIATLPKNYSRINYSRRMYAIIRRYTPDVVEGGTNECFADLTGLRTFFKMSYAEIAEKIKKELASEIGIRFALRVATVAQFEKAKLGKKSHGTAISTYKEINKLFVGSSYVAAPHRKQIKLVRGRRLAVPFIGKIV